MLLWCRSISSRVVLAVHLLVHNDKAMKHIKRYNIVLFKNISLVQPMLFITGVNSKGI